MQRATGREVAGKRRAKIVVKEKDSSFRLSGRAVVSHSRPNRRSRGSRYRRKP